MSTIPGQALKRMQSSGLFSGARHHLHLDEQIQDGPASENEFDRYARKCASKCCCCLYQQLLDGKHRPYVGEISLLCYTPHNLRNIDQGTAAFNANPSSYQVFRNVKSFGAKGDGVTDDTAAINAAISSGNRCGINGSCGSSTTTPAVVYFPAGVYMISSSIIDLYYTMIIGNPNCMPTIRAVPTYSGGLGMIDANPYGSSGRLAYG